MGDFYNTIGDRQNNIQGFSLVEVMVTAGIAGAMALGTAQMFGNNTKMLSNVGSSNDFNSLVTQIQGVLNNSTQAQAMLNASQPSSASAVFSGTAFTSKCNSAAPVAFSTPVSYIPLIMSSGGITIIPSTGAYNTLTGVQFQATQCSLISAANSTYLIYFTLSANKQAGAVGASTLSRVFAVSLTMDSSGHISSVAGSTDTTWAHGGASPTDIYYTAGNVAVSSLAVGNANAAIPTGQNSVPRINLAGTDTNHFIASSGTAGGDGTPGNGGNATYFGEYTSPDRTASDPASGWNFVSTGGTTNIQRAFIDGGGYYHQVSDRRMKRDIQPLQGSLNKILSLDGVSFLWKESHSNQNRSIGLIAQDIEKVFPEIVHTNKEGMKDVSYSTLVSPIISAIKEFYLKWNNENAALKEENRQIKAYLCKRDASAPFCH